MKRESVFRFLSVASLMLAAGVLLQARGRLERVPEREELVNLPHQVGEWAGRDRPILPEVRQVLGNGDFLARFYSRSSDEPYVELFVAYFPTQRTGSTIHSPQNCLPGAGWIPLESGRVPISAPGEPPVTVNRYLMGRGLDRQLILYWYQSHSRVIASEYWAKIYLVTDSIRLNRSDGSLVRLSTPLIPGEDPKAGERRLVEFAQGLRPLLGPYIPR
jgi:EpsI family protein